MLRLCLALILFHPLSIPAQGESPVEIKPGDPEPIREELYSFNSNLLMSTALHGIGYRSSEFRKGLEDLRPTGLRFPGGTTANNYLWKDDSFAEQDDDKTEWAAQQLALFRKIGRPYDLPGFAEACSVHNLTPIYVLNIYHETPESVVALFERFDELGLEVKAVEFGNEPYWDPRSLMNVWQYIEYCRPLAEAIRKHRPEVKIGACFGPLREGSNYAEKWNAPLAQQKWYDAIIYHEYYGGQGIAMEEGSSLSLEALLHPEAFIDEPIEYFETLRPDLPIWFTEWNVGAKGLEQWKNTGAELLFLGASTMRILDHRDQFDWSCFHQIYEEKFGTFYHDREKGIQTLPSYEFFRLFGSLWQGADSFHSIATSPGASVRAIATSGDDGFRILLLNRSDLESTVRLPEESSGHSAIAITTDPTQKLPISESITAERKLEGTELSLPAYSVTLVAPPSRIQSASRKEPSESGNLFPVRPHLTLWYPPYARSQPRVLADGSYRVDLEPLADKETVVIKMDLSGIAPEPGDRYAVSFLRQASRSLGLVAQVPDRTKAEGKWIQLLPKPENTRLEFTFDPESNDGNVTLLLSQNALAGGGSMTLKDFRLVKIASSPNTE